MSLPDAARRWIAALELLPHPEGGHYRETYRASEAVAGRSLSTAIYFLLTAESFSALHRIRSDELWHFHAGDPLQVVTLDPAGVRRDLLLGLEVERGASPQHCVSAGRWFGARLASAEHGYCLVSCTVAPGFDFADFELARRASLTAGFPHHAEVIASLTRA
jgi:uncharacterized protein